MMYRARLHRDYDKVVEITFDFVIDDTYTIMKGPEQIFPEFGSTLRLDKECGHSYKYIDENLGFVSEIRNEFPDHLSDYRTSWSERKSHKLVSKFDVGPNPTKDNSICNKLSVQRLTYSDKSPKTWFDNLECETITELNAVNALLGFEKETFRDINYLRVQNFPLVDKQIREINEINPKVLEISGVKVHPRINDSVYHQSIRDKMKSVLIDCEFTDKFLNDMSLLYKRKETINCRNVVIDVVAKRDIVISLLNKERVESLFFNSGEVDSKLIGQFPNLKNLYCSKFKGQLNHPSLINFEADEISFRIEDQHFKGHCPELCSIKINKSTRIKLSYVNGNDEPVNDYSGIRLIIDSTVNTENLNLDNLVVNINREVSFTIRLSAKCRYFRLISPNGQDLLSLTKRCRVKSARSAR